MFQRPKTAWGKCVELAALLAVYIVVVAWMDSVVLFVAALAAYAAVQAAIGYVTGDDRASGRE